MLKKLIKEFIDILEETEESNSGRVFHPVTINSCRVLKTKRIAHLINEIKKCINYDELPDFEDGALDIKENNNE